MSKYEIDVYEASDIPPSGLCDCPECRSNLVYPIGWKEENDTMIRLERLCPNCEWTGEGIYDYDLLEIYGSELDEADETMKIADLRIMRDRAHNFGEALQAGNILPEDF
jgi:hypothetical protein